MKCCICLLAAATALGGCQSTQLTSQDPVVFAMGDMGPARADSAIDDVFAFGAGDAIGQEVFIYYVASIRADEFFATGESPFIRDE